MTTDSDVKGTQEPASSESSDNASNQKGSSGTEFVSVAEFNKLNQQLEALRRSLQSDKDKAVKQTNKRLEVVENDLRTVLQSAAQNGKSVSDLLNDLEAQEEIETRQMIRELAQVVKGGGFQPSSRGSGQSDGVDVSEVVKTLELDTNDMRVKAFMAQSFASKEDALLEGAKVLKTILRTQPSDADLPSDVTKKTQTATDQEKLMQEYTEGSKNLYGMQLIKFKQKMREKGLRSIS